MAKMVRMAMSDDLLRLRQETLASMQERTAREAESLVEQINDQRQQARQAYQNGDTGTAQYYDENLMALESELQQKYLELQGRAQPQPLTPTQTELLNKYRGELHKPHWSGMPGASNYHALEWGDAYARAAGVDPNSQQYRDIIEVVAPKEGEQLPSPDEICRDLGLSPRQYNRGVRQLQARKAKGEYR
jgi:hypothetical protein